MFSIILNGNLLACIRHLPRPVNINNYTRFRYSPALISLTNWLATTRQTEKSLMFFNVNNMYKKKRTIIGQQISNDTRNTGGYAYRVYRYFRLVLNFGMTKDLGFDQLNNKHLANSLLRNICLWGRFNVTKISSVTFLMVSFRWFNHLFLKFKHKISLLAW